MSQLVTKYIKILWDIFYLEIQTPSSFNKIWLLSGLNNIKIRKFLVVRHKTTTDFFIRQIYFYNLNLYLYNIMQD